jgi:hypothetical protein
MDEFVANPRRHRHRFERGREHATDRAEQAARFVESAREVAEGLGEADQHQISERVIGELPGPKAVLERGRPRIAVARQGDQTPPEITRCRNVEIPPQAPGTPAVVGDTHDRGDFARVFAQCA